MTDLNPISDQVENVLDQSKNLLPRILILGGTGEGAELASRLAQRRDLWTISSLAGRVSEPQRPEGIVRIGGFGGVDGLASYLVKESVRVVVDVTHPFAVRISRNAELACARLGLPLIAFVRPFWVQTKEDLWHNVVDFKEAADVVDSTEGRVFLSIGRQEADLFADCNNAWFLIRAIQEPSGRLPRHHEILLRRGPFSFDDELQLLRDYSIDYVVSKNSGGSATYAKIIAARLLGVPVVMIARPVKHSIPVAKTIDEVLLKIDRLIRVIKRMSR